MLTPRQKQFLKGLAHPLSPVVRIGKAGLTPAVIIEAKRALEAHELIKARIEADDAEARASIADELARATNAELAATIGKLAILYRARPENPAIALPK